MGLSSANHGSDEFDRFQAHRNVDDKSLDATAHLVGFTKKTIFLAKEPFQWPNFGRCVHVQPESSVFVTDCSPSDSYEPSRSIITLSEKRNPSGTNRPDSLRLRGDFEISIGRVSDGIKSSFTVAIAIPNIGSYDLIFNVVALWVLEGKLSERCETGEDTVENFTLLTHGQAKVFGKRGESSVEIQVKLVHAQEQISWALYIKPAALNEEEASVKPGST